jgi:hypothetical protein
MTPHVFVPTYNRRHVLRVCLPPLAESCRRAGAKLVTVDDRSDDPRVRPFLYRHADEVHVSERRLMRAGDLWGPRRRIAWHARQLGLGHYLKVDADVLVGPRAVGQWFDAAEAVPPDRRGTLAAVAKRAPWDDCPEPFRVDGWTFRQQVDDGDFLWHDCAHVVFLSGGCTVRVDDEARRVTYGPPSPACNLGIADPQLDVQHLGVGCAVDGFWRGRGGGTFRRHPCVSGLTGERVEVEGFDLDLWLACTQIGPAALEAFADGEAPPQARALEAKRAPVRVVRGRDVQYIASRAAANRLERRRTLILWTGAWQGDRTRRLLGVGPRDPLVRVCPDGYAHPWLREKTEN